MTETLHGTVRAVALSFAVVLMNSGAATAQQEKGNKEILFFSGGFFFTVDQTRFRDADFKGTGSVGLWRGASGLSFGGQLGYFLTRRNEIGGGVSLYLYHSKFCVRTFSDGQFTGEACSSDTYFAMSLDAFYRYHFAREGARKFFFVGADLSAADVTRNYTGNIRVRPHVGYRYFLDKKIALDFSVGYSAELNKQVDGFFPRDREGSIVGQLSLSFLF
jgi:hypothetical protein